MKNDEHETLKNKLLSIYKHHHDYYGCSKCKRQTLKKIYNDENIQYQECTICNNIRKLYRADEGDETNIEFSIHEKYLNHQNNGDQI